MKATTSKIQHLKPAQTARRRRRASQGFIFEIFIGNGLSDDVGKRRRRRLSYPKKPEQWTGLDVLKVAERMAASACTTMRTPPTDRNLHLHFSHRYEGTILAVSQRTGAWATLPPRFHIPSMAIGDLFAVSQSWGWTVLTMDATRPPDPTAVRKQRQELARFIDQLRAGIVIPPEAPHRPTLVRNIGRPVITIDGDPSRPGA